MWLTKFFFSFILFFNFIGMASAQPVFLRHCPANIMTSQKLLGSFEGWREFNTSFQHSLSNIEMYDGKPEELACLKPDSHSNEKMVWHFHPNSKKYMVCQYNDTNIQLTRPLPLTVTQCILFYKKYSFNKRGGSIPDYIACQ